jgi:hypothetical protein
VRSFAAKSAGGFGIGIRLIVVADELQLSFHAARLSFDLDHKAISLRDRAQPCMAGLSETACFTNTSGCAASPQDLSTTDEDGNRALRHNFVRLAAKH